MIDLIPQNSWPRTSMLYGTNGTPSGGIFDAMRKEIDQVFDQFGDLSSATASYRGSPRMNIGETESSIEIEAELPGVEEKDIELALNEDVLTIKGEKRMDHDEQHKDYYRKERLFGKFARSITLPFEPDPKTVKTHFAKGVLKITLPKSATVKQQTVKIPVKAAV